MSYGQYSDRSRGKQNPLAQRGAAPKRQRQVYPTSEVPHKWAHQAQAAARNPQGNLFFDDATIYSYRRSWPLARIYSKPCARILVLANSNRYSVTTATHQSAVNRAASHLHVVSVPHVERNPGADGELMRTEHAANIAYLVDMAAACLKRAQRSMKDYAVGYARETAQRALQDAQRYSDFFGLRRKIPAFPETEWGAAAARVARIENPDPASADKRERARALRQAAQAKRDEAAREQRRILAQNAEVHNAARRTDWRLGGAFAAGSGYLRITGPVMLRIAGDSIETSMGASIPLAAAPMVWNAVQRAIAQGGRVYGTSGLAPRVMIGDYPLDRIDADGTLHVGCHHIPHVELRTMARQLGLAS